MDRYNHEGYPDPTAYDALTAVAREEKAKRYLPLVYIASPFAGDTERNIAKARDYCRFAVSKGCIPLAPHLHYPQFMEDTDKAQRARGSASPSSCLVNATSYGALATRSARA